MDRLDRPVELSVRQEAVMSLNQIDARSLPAMAWVLPIALPRNRNRASMNSRWGSHSCVAIVKSRWFCPQGSLPVFIRSGAGRSRPYFGDGSDAVDLA